MRSPLIRSSTSVGRWTATAALCLLAACNRPVPRLAPLAPGAVILAFGDSVTYGTGAEPSESYPKVLEELTRHSVVNAGLPGEVTEEGLRRLPGVLDVERPALLILCHGGNDFLRHETDERIEQNLMQMAELATTRGLAVVLIGVPKPGLVLRTSGIYSKVARDLALPLENNVLRDIESDASLKSDLIHPNREGYRKLAQAVLDLLKESGAL